MDTRKNESGKEVVPVALPDNPVGWKKTMTLHTGVLLRWEWRTPVSYCTNVSEEEAHALIFRAMVEGLGKDFNLAENMHGQWMVWASFDGGDGPRADTAIEALLAFWEPRPPT